MECSQSVDIIYVCVIFRSVESGMVLRAVLFRDDHMRLYRVRRASDIIYLDFFFHEFVLLLISFNSVLMIGLPHPEMMWLYKGFYFFCLRR